MPPGFFVTFITCKKYSDNIIHVCEKVAYNECGYFNGVKFDSLYATLCWHVRLIAEIRIQKCLPDNLHVFQLPFSKLYLHRSWWKLRIRKINLILVKLYQNISPSHAIMFTKITLFMRSLKKWRRNAVVCNVSKLWKELQWLGINDSNGVGWVPLQRIIGISLPRLCVVFVELSLITVMSSSTLCPETQLRCYVFGLHYE